MGIPVKDSRRQHLTLFTSLIFAFCVVMFLIHCDLIDFPLTPSFHSKSIL